MSRIPSRPPGPPALPRVAVRPAKALAEPGPAPRVAGDFSVVASPPSATPRDAATRPAPLSLLDSLEESLRLESSPQARQRLVDAFFRQVQALGGTPLSRGDEVAFVVQGTGRWSVEGNFGEGWGSPLPLEPMAGTDLQVLRLRLPRDQAYEYKLLQDGRYLEDRAARSVVWDGVDHSDVGEMNAVVHPDLQRKDQGRLVALRAVRSEVLGNARDVFVYLPPAYDNPHRPLPTLYFQDGNEHLTRSAYAQQADAFYREHPEASAVLVFVALPRQEDRLPEYTFGPEGKAPLYVEFLKRELIPSIEARFSVSRRREDRGIAGASLGGLVSSFAALQEPSLFGFVGSQSGSYFWEKSALVQRARDLGRSPVRFFIDRGGNADNGESNDAFVEALRSQNSEVTYQVIPEHGHDWSAWKARLPSLLEAFRPPSAASP